MQAIGCLTTHENVEVVEKSQVVVIATKPPLVPKVLTEVNSVVTTENLIISIAMGIPLINLEQVLLTHCHLLAGGRTSRMLSALLL